MRRVITAGRLFTSLTNQIALVTGASSGIGKAIALALAAEGTTLCLVGRILEKLETVADAARRTARDVRCIPTDLTCDEDIHHLAARLQRDLDRVDLLIHCAGHCVPGRVESVVIGDLDRQYRINVRAPYLLTQALLPMLRSCRGQIVFVNSSAGFLASANLSQYAATKHALRAIADSLRQEVNADGIRVLSIYPGRTASPMQAAVHAMEGKVYDPDRLVQPEDISALVITALSLPRTAEVTDIHVRPFLKP